MTARSPIDSNAPDSSSTVPLGDRAAGGPIPSKHRKSEGLEVVEVYRRSALPGVELWSVKSSPRLWTSFNTRYVFTVGERADCRQRYVVRRNQYAMLPRLSIGTIHPGEAHATTLVEPAADFHALFIDEATMARECEVNLGARRPPCFDVTQVDDARLVKLLLEAATAMEERSSMPAELEERLMAFLEVALHLTAKVRLDYPKTTHEPRAIRRVQEIIVAEASSRITLKRLADEVGFSPWHLARLFKAHMGLPIHRFQTKVRLANAMDLLRAGSSVGEAAQSAGFADQPHLTRVMRGTLGMTPARYQRQCVRLHEHVESRPAMRPTGHGAP